MRITVGPGTYVVAVSGGVDSMVLLDLLRQKPGLKLVVAHFDHGIRTDSAEDKKIVHQVAKKHGLPFVTEQGKLGSRASEAIARKARYAFLSRVKQASQAKAIITAHHQDDALETAIINLIRGTGRRGITSLGSNLELARPMLDYSKDQIREYAQDHLLLWREDPTNLDPKYLRNYIRHKLIPKFSDGQRAQMMILMDQLKIINDELNNKLTGMLHVQPAINELDKSWFIKLPHNVSREVLHAWLKQHGARDVTKRTIERLVTAVKTGKTGHSLDVDNRYKIVIKGKVLALLHRDR